MKNIIFHQGDNPVVNFGIGFACAFGAMPKSTTGITNLLLDVYIGIVVMKFAPRWRTFLISNPMLILRIGCECRELNVRRFVYNL